MALSLLPFATALAQSPAVPADSTIAPVGAPTVDSLARLVAARFATGTAAGFDSVYTAPLGRRVMHTAVERASARDGGPARIVWSARDRAVLLFTPTVHAGHGHGISSGGDETNQVRRLSGFYEAVRQGDSWHLGSQIPLDTSSYIRAQRIHVALVPGHESTIVDTLDVSVGSPYGFAVRFNNHATLESVRLDGANVEHQLAGGVLWVAARPARHARLALRYAIADEPMPRPDSARHDGDTLAFGALENTDAWLPFFNYDSAHDLASLTVTVTIPSIYQLTTSVPQTEHVAGGVRTVHGISVHPEFILSLIYDKDWQSKVSKIGDLTFQTFVTSRFPFTHDSLATLVGHEYRLLTPRFGEPQAPSHYLAVVENRVLHGAGFTVRMNNAVVAGDNTQVLDEPAIGPSSGFAHEVAHGWTMDATGPAANFLQEGWATYCEGLVLADRYGPAASQAMWERLRTSYIGGQDRAGFLGGFEGRQSLLGDPDNGRIHYYKGSWIFHQLEYMLGDSVFDRGMRAFVRHAGYGPNGFQELIADLSAAAGRHVSSLVMPWLTERYIPDVDAHVEGSSVIVEQLQPTRPFDLPLDVELLAPAGAVRRTVHLTARADTIAVGGLGVTDARVDPDHHFLLRRHWGDTARFALRAPEAQRVELTGNFLGKPIAATRTGDLWMVSLPLTAGRYVWFWRVDGKGPSDVQAIADASRPNTDDTARAGVLVVKPNMRLPASDAR